MDKKEDSIVVYKVYNNTIPANLSKTKLDAYGIPCFLSEEHVGNLFPFRNGSFGGVRLHIFKKDKEKVKAILEV